MLSLSPWSLVAAVAVVVAACSAPPQPAPAGAPAVDRIHWQRSLDDALAVAAATGRPLLVAVNMDGESASDRIWRERYRDPRFVALTRHCVCLPASVFRHNARDHDDEGRRIECPRFRGVTCGEHMALEPVLYERFLADGDRVAPRHALVRADGSKAFDLSLCFDFGDIEQALAAAVGQPAGGPAAAALPRDAAVRAAREAWCAAAAPADLVAWLAQPDAVLGVDALLRVLPRLGDDPALPGAFAAAVRARGASAAIGAALCARRQDPAPTARPATAAQAAAERDVLAQLDDADGAFGLFAAAEAALAGDGAGSFAGVLAALRAGTAAGGHGDGRTDNPRNTLAAADVLEREIATVEPLLAQRRDDAELLARFALASLDLGRVRLAEGKRDAQLLLEDAASYWRRALAADATRGPWWLERARTAYFLGNHDEQVDCGRRALALATGRPAGELPADAAQLSADAAEALRWLGDGRARLLGAPAGQGEAALREGMLAFGLVAASPHATVKDMVSFASFLGALSCWRAEVEVATAAAARFPAAGELRDLITQALWRSGAIEHAYVVQKGVHRAAPTAESKWFCGQAALYVAEQARRSEDAAAAIGAYELAVHWFGEAMAANAGYAEDCRQRIAGACFGKAMAHVVGPDRGAAVKALQEALAASPDPALLRDGLGYDARDVVDRLLEWRETGASPLTATALAKLFAAVAPTESFWPAAVADAAIREGLRADGRNPDRVERETVDAGGKPVRTMMGRATGLGDGWVQEAMAIARTAHALATSGPGVAAERLAETRTTAAQACLLWAERQLERGRRDGVVVALGEAADLLGASGPAADASGDALAAAAAALRLQLGPARPLFRESR